MQWCRLRSKCQSLLFLLKSETRVLYPYASLFKVSCRRIDGWLTARRVLSVSLIAFAQPHDQTNVSFEEGPPTGAASLPFSELFFQITNEVLQSPFYQWIDRPGGHSARLFTPAAPIPADRYCRPVIGHWRLRFLILTLASHFQSTPTTGHLRIRTAFLKSATGRHRGCKPL
jgi:hypothetical protein